jgi:UDP-3-O-[3-hydroxymyristoyl] glucosamine N-acyltransferase
MSKQGYAIGELAERLAARVLGDPSVQVEQVATLASAGPTHISFYHRGGYEAALASTAAGAVILAPEDAERSSKPRLVIANPYLAFARVAQILNPPVRPTVGIDTSARVAVDAQIDPSASIGAFVSIGAGTRIGAGVIVDSGCAIGERVVIGAGSRLYPRVTIYTDCAIGERAILHAGVVIGADGFGFANERGSWVKIPQIGRVQIHDDVEIGANSTIDRGALDDTIIESGVKLDNQVQIGHNCRIGAHTAIAGCVGIAGSTTIGRYCMIGGAAMIAGHLTLGDRVVVAGGTLISKSISEPGTYAGVFPFEQQKNWQRTAVHVRNLERMDTRVKALEASLNASGIAHAVPRSEKKNREDKS